MTRSKNILIVGGAGFIGSHVNLVLQDAGYTTFIFDNLSTGNRKAAILGTFIQGDLKNCEEIESLFSTYPIDAVMHFAALTDVGESMKNPAKYYQSNVTFTLNLLDAMVKHHVKTLIFSSSAAVYGMPHESPVTEKTRLAPINPYGKSKQMVEMILLDYSRAFGLQACSLRYFNAAGGDPTSRIKNYQEHRSNLIPLALQSLLQPDGEVTVFGNDYSTKDGTGIRDYIHVYDLAEAHKLALEKLLQEGQTSCYNLGNGEGFSVLDVLAAVEKVTKKKVHFHFGERRAGDPPILVADASLAKLKLGWEPKFPTLHSMIEHAWVAMQK